MIVGAQLIYRLADFVRLLIDYRNDSTDSFNFYWAPTSVGPYSLFKTINNIPSKEPQFRNKILVEFSPSLISGWDNQQTNFMKMAPVISGVEGLVEGPIEIPTRLELTKPADKFVVYGFEKATQQYIPISVNHDGEVITA